MQGRIEKNLQVTARQINRQIYRWEILEIGRNIKILHNWHIISRKLHNNMIQYLFDIIII